MRVLVVGASIGGSRVAAGLRESGYTGSIVLVDPDPDAPYDRPPLSKQVLAGTWAPSEVSLGTPEQWQAERHVAAAAGLDPSARRLTLDSGVELDYDRLVLACGAAPRTFPNAPSRGVHVLRTLADCLALRADLDRLGGGPLVVVGGGFVGAEVAATARGLGVDVTLVEALPAPLAGVLGVDVAHELAPLHEDNGVRLVCGVGVTRLVGADEVTGVELADGRTLPAAAVVVGLGVRPNTGWLAGSGIELDAGGGIRCDEYCAVDAERTIFALGDVARPFDPGVGRQVRVEHWSNAVEQAATVVRNIVEPTPTAHHHMPFFWSDQYGSKLQLLGYPDPGDPVTIVHGSGPRRRFAVAYHRGPVLTAVLTLNWPKALVVARKALGTARGAEDAVAEWKNL